MTPSDFVARSLLGATCLAFSACTTLGPDFETPQADLAETWDKQSAALSAGPEAESWWAAFKDPVLDKLVEMSYQQNLPLQVAGLRIFEARAQLGIAIGQQYPQQQQLNGDLTRVGLSKNSPNFDSALADDNFTQSSIGLDAAWELDFWGRFRRGVESAGANLGASIADYDNALVVDPTSVEAYGNRGNARRHSEDFTGAADDYRNVLRMAPSDWPHRTSVQHMLSDIEEKYRTRQDSTP